MEQKGWRLALKKTVDRTIAAAGLVALSPLIAATAIGHPISRRKFDVDGRVPEGRLRVDRGWLRRTSVTISSAVTTDDLARASSRVGERSLTRAHQLDGLRAALALLTAALYRREPARDAAALDDAVRHALGMAGDVPSWRRGPGQGFGLHRWLGVRWRR